MDWQPRGGFFGAMADAGLGGAGLDGKGSALSFSPGLLNILAGSNDS